MSLFASDLGETFTLVNASLIAADGVHEGAVLRVRDGKIDGIGRELGPVGEEFDLRGAWVAPGFVDLHVHGGNGRDAMEADARAFDEICASHAAGGTTRLLLTTMTAPLGEICAVLTEVASYMVTGQEAGAKILGVHVEGPFLSPAKPGVHPVDLLDVPTDQSLDLLMEHRRVLKRLTIAPELPGALPAIARLEREGIRTSAGHTDAGEDVMGGAVRAGLRQATHLYNCMSGARRNGAFREAGAIEFCLGDHRMYCEVIADGAHVSPALLRLAHSAKGAEGMMLVTDATAGTGLPEGTRYPLGPIEAVVGRKCGMLPDGSALAGSCCRMIDCVKEIVATLGLSVPTAVRMAASTPAIAMGCERFLGSLADGRAADLVVFDENFTILGTFVDGRCVYFPS